MATFYDDFERANGAIGNNWVSELGGTINIAGGSINGYVRVVARQSSVSNSGRNEAACHVFHGSATTQGDGPAVKMTAGSASCYLCRILAVAGVQTFQIVKWVPSTETILASLALGSVAPYNLLSLVWDTAHLTATINGGSILECDDTSLASGQYCGFSGLVAAQTIADCRIVAGNAVLFSVTPAPIGNYGSALTVTFAGVGTSWTPGTPGAPTFTVDHGTLSAQTVDSATSAHATYDPGTFLGNVTFTDPSTGLVAVVLVTSNPATVPIGGAGLTDSIVSYLQRSADAETDSTIINRNESFTAYGVTKTISESIQTIHGTLSEATFASGGQAGILALIIQVFDLLNGGLDWGGAATIFGNTSLIKSGVDDLATTLADVQGPGGVSLAVLAAALSDLRGTGSPSLADVLSAASGGGDYTAILDAITAARGTGAPSLATLVSSLGAIRTTDAYTLGSVKGWIDGLPHGGDTVSALAVVALVAALALAIPTGGASIAAEAVAVGAGPLLDIATLVEVVSVLGELAGIASSISSIRHSLGSAQLAAPVWPGADLVTLGTSHDLADGLIVDGPMHGLIVTIGGHPNGAGKYAFGSVMSWQHCGAVVFANDSGHYERAESFGLPSQIISPRTMASAASATVRLNGGWSGSIRGWSVTP